MDACRGASFGPLAAISRRRQGGHIYNNTRAHEPLRRMCVKPAALTTHSPLKISARPRTATRPSQALPLPHAAPMHSPHSADARPPTSPPIPRRRPSLAPHSDTPSQTLLLAHAAPTHTRRPHNPFPAEGRHPSPSTFSLPPRPNAHPHAAPTHARRLRDAFPADRTTPSPQRHAASPSVPLRAQKNGTAQWMCDAECLGRPSLRSVIGIGEPRAVRHRYGALACRRGA